MIINLHYIDDKWEMRSASIEFKRVIFPHTGGRLAESFIEAVGEMSSRLLRVYGKTTAGDASANYKMWRASNNLLPDRIKYHI
jgi:hypothetical protein